MSDQESRREFVRSLARGSALAALAGLVGWLGARRKGRSCSVPSCSRCPMLRSCSLPAAVRARKGLGRDVPEAKG